jgi:5-methylcytosine-specific restriction protein B
MRFLYHWAGRPDSQRIVKIAPGHNAEFWQDCLNGEYICVGWDEVGDLREFDSRESFRERFTEVFGERYSHQKSTLTKKGNELWTLIELEPGDLVVANQGTSMVLAVGEVVEPGYEWLSERQEYRHIVRVRWDKSYAREIESQKKWALVTVAPVQSALYEQIMKRKPGLASPPPVSPLFMEIKDAIERKCQVILYGPPGTGKTYQARRFAVWWLLQHEKEAGSQPVLTDRDAFDRAERRLSAVQLSNRVWWMVANQKEWHWNKLFPSGKKVQVRPPETQLSTGPAGRSGRRLPVHP